MWVGMDVEIGLGYSLVNITMNKRGITCGSPYKWIYQISQLSYTFFLPRSQPTIHIKERNRVVINKFHFKFSANYYCVGLVFFNDHIQN